MSTLVLSLLLVGFMVGSATAQLCPEDDLNDDFKVNCGDIQELTEQWLWSGVTLVVNEFMASNNSDSGISDPQGEYDDWVEIYNFGDTAINIGGMYLTDDLDEPTKWQIPDDNPSETTVEPNDYILIWADGDFGDGPLHADFKLSAGGEQIGLFDTDGIVLIDGIIFGEQTTNISYGRYPDATNGWRYMSIPTPAVQNNAGYLGHVDEVEFSHERGFYTEGFDVTMAISTEGADIYYTIDGSEPINNEMPSASSIEYTGAIAIGTTSFIRAAAIKSGWKPSNIETHTYIFLDDVLNQPASPNGFPSTWGVYVYTNRGNPVPADYGMDPSITVERASLESLPSLSIVMDINDLFDPDYGIYSNPTKKHEPTEGEDWERATSLEYIDPNGGAGFQIDCAIRIQGGWSRRPWDNPKHSFRVLFKSDYGPSSLEFPLFGEDASDSFNCISLRGSFNDGWATIWNSGTAQYIRDQWARETQLAMGHASSHGTWVHLYINGLYWGLFNPVERPDGHFMAEYFGGDEDDYDVFNHNSLHNHDGSRWYKGDDRKPAIDGDFIAWDAMMAMADAGVYTYEQYLDIKKYLDVDNYIDHMIYNRYIGCWTWTSWNFYVGRKREPNEGFKFFSWDAEQSIQSYNSTRGWDIGNRDGTPGHLFGAMKNNTQFRMDFADRLHKHMFNNGLLTPQAGKDRWMALDAQIFDALIAELGRWGSEATMRDIDYIAERTRILNSFFPNRTIWALYRFRNEGLYPNIEAPIFYIDGDYQHGGHVSNGAVLTIDNPGTGTIYYTIDSDDPRTCGSGTVAGTAYAGPITLSETIHVKARVLSGGGTWSALNEAIFAIGPVKDNLRVTEIMYHPLDTGEPDDPNAEYIELTNIGAETINLNLVKFTKGIDFTFPNTTLSTGQYVLVVKDAVAFESKYGTEKPVAGMYSGSLANGGERIRLEDAMGQTILDFKYEDDWFNVTDGEGFSLTIFNEHAEPNAWDDKANWYASKHPGGTPGADDS